MGLTNIEFNDNIVIKKNVSLREFQIQKIAYENNIPTSKPLEYDYENKIMKMEKLNGQTLQEFMDSEPRRWELTKRIILRTISRILQKLNEIGIEYYDIKGDNIIIDSKRNLSFIDFGHCKYMRNKWKISKTDLQRIYWYNFDEKSNYERVYRKPSEKNTIIESLDKFNEPYFYMFDAENNYYETYDSDDVFNEFEMYFNKDLEYLKENQNFLDRYLNFDKSFYEEVDLWNPHFCN